MKSILLVCTGNTCRSAMAEAIFKDAIEQSEDLDGHIKVESAGTFACEGQPATDKAQTVIEEMGLDLSRHKAQQVDTELCEWADLILTMEQSHIEQLEAMVPQAENKLHTILEFVNEIEPNDDEELEIGDPYGADVDEYQQCAMQLKEAIDKIIKYLEKSR